MCICRWCEIEAREVVAFGLRGAPCTMGHSAPRLGSELHETLNLDHSLPSSKEATWASGGHSAGMGFRPRAALKAHSLAALLPPAAPVLRNSGAARRPRRPVHRLGAGASSARAASVRKGRGAGHSSRDSTFHVPSPGLGKLGARVSPAPRSWRACHFLSQGLRVSKMREKERPRPGFSGTLGFFQLGLDSGSAPPALRAANSCCDAPGGHARKTRRDSAGARARRGRGRLGLRLRKAVPDAAPAQWRGGAGRREAVAAAAAAEEEEEGDGGRCFCQFRLFVREVDPPLPEQPGGSCGSRGQYRPRPPARTAPARHGPGLRPPLQAAHHRRQRCGQKQFTVAICRQHFLRQLYHHNRSGFQDPDRGDQWGEGEAADLGHGGAGALPHHHLDVLSGDPRGHCSLRRHQCRVLCQRQAVASRNQPEL
uniref:RAB35, member RAS onco family n=1 Tax=Callithrix jacchus TaxID=9483 RepID=F6ZNF5_CALJA|nr:ras-related protein Rab-35 isoform X1 [Callithrix jacchus]